MTKPAGASEEQCKEVTMYGVLEGDGKMFQVGEYVVYGSNGVCKVEEIGPLKIGGMKDDRIYYFLLPLYSNGSRLYTPVDNQKVVIRAVISREEADELLEDIDSIETIPGENGKNRDNVYKDFLKSYNCRDMLRIIKTVDRKKKARIAEGKHLVVNDERYLKIAKDCLFGELAIPLEKRPDEVEEMIRIRFLVE